LAPYHELINKEAEIIGVSDHLASELPLLIEWVRTKKLNLDPFITRTITLDEKEVNPVLDSLESGSGDIRIVIVNP
jgi:propanol-preferring alcohol dehydrogenase